MRPDTPSLALRLVAPGLCRRGGSWRTSYLRGLPRELHPARRNPPPRPGGGSSPLRPSRTPWISCWLSNRPRLDSPPDDPGRESAAHSQGHLALARTALQPPLMGQGGACRPPQRRTNTTAPYPPTIDPATTICLGLRMTPPSLPARPQKENTEVPVPSLHHLERTTTKTGT